MTELFRPSAADPEDLLAGLGRSWLWTLAFGALTAVAGIIMLAWPHATLRIVAIIIGIQLLVAGGVRFVTAFSRSGERASGPVVSVLLAVVSMLAGVLVLRHQLQTVGVLALVVGATWLVAGLMTGYVALADRDMRHRGVSVFFAAIGVIAGIVVLSYPVQSVTALARLIGLWLLLLGLVEVGLSFAVRAARPEHRTTATPLPRSVG